MTCQHGFHTMCKKCELEMDKKLAAIIQELSKANERIEKLEQKIKSKTT